MHEITKDMEVLQQAIVRYSVERMRMDPPEIDAPMTPAQLMAMAGQTITVSYTHLTLPTIHLV